MRETAVYIVKDDPLKVERAFLVATDNGDSSTGTCEELLNELAELTDTLGIQVVGREKVRVRKPNSRFFIGSGKAEELLQSAQSCRADVIIFDDALSPSQQRNWEELTSLAVIDRQEVILDIFASRAQTREASLQVALARATYSLPRLRRRWTHLHRQRGMQGGMGMRGEGEQQIEMDSRMVRIRIARLKQQLLEVQKNRDTQRSRRLKKPVPVAAIVGYTNAGKSSLLNAMTAADVLVEDKLFATLDSTVRRVALPNKQELLLADTVGFIRKLPHLLVEAFKSTLEEARFADLLIEVIDITGGQLEEHHHTTREVLKEIGAGDKRVLTVFNKVDLVNDPLNRRRVERKYPDALFVSARTGLGLRELEEALSRELDAALHYVELRIPHNRYDLIARLHRTSAILAERYEDDAVHITANVPGEAFRDIELFLANADQ